MVYLLLRFDIYKPIKLLVLQQPTILDNLMSLDFTSNAFWLDTHNIWTQRLPSIPKLMKLVMMNLQ